MTLLDGPLLPKSETDTRPKWRGTGPVRRSRAIRRVLLAVFTTFLALGATGVFGVRAGTVSEESGPWGLKVTYPKVTRPGHAVPLRFEVHKDGGFGSEPVTLRVSSAYFDLFDENAMDPDPATSSATDEFLLYEFDPPPGEVIEISLDTRTGPNRMSGAKGFVAVVSGGQDVVSVEFRTRVMP